MRDRAFALREKHGGSRARLHRLGKFITGIEAPAILCSRAMTDKPGKLAAGGCTRGARKFGAALMESREDACAGVKSSVGPSVFFGGARCFAEVGWMSAGLCAREI